MCAVQVEAELTVVPAVAEIEATVLPQNEHVVCDQIFDAELDEPGVLARYVVPEGEASTYEYSTS